MKYYCNKKKVILLLLVILVICGIGIGFSIKWIPSISICAVCISTIAMLCGVAFINVLSNLKAELIIEKDYIESKRGNKSVKLFYKDIQSIKYRGIKLIPVFDIIAIFAQNGKMIFIDFNFENYLHLWEQVVKRCLEANRNINIDKTILSRISKTMKKAGNTEGDSVY